MSSGIYQIVNINTGKSYIGSSSRIHQRFYEHKNALRKNKHFNRYLQNAWNKYGEDNFVFRILEEVSKEDSKRYNLLHDLENVYINKYLSNIEEKGYNIESPILSTKITAPKNKNQKTTPFKTKEFFENHKLLNELSPSYKELLIKEILNFTNTHLITIKKIKIYPCISIKLINKTNKEITFIHIDSIKEKVLDNEEYNNLVKKEKVIYEIENGTSTIINIFNNTNEILTRYNNIKRADLENVLYNYKPNRISTCNKIFILKDNYDSNTVYTIRNRKQIYHIDIDGSIKEVYPTIEHLLTKNPNLNKHSLSRILITKPTPSYPFIYSDNFDNIDKYSKEELASSLKKNTYMIVEIDKDGSVVNTFKNPKEILNKYPQISRKNLDKVLYEKNKSVNGKIFKRILSA